MLYIDKVRCTDKLTHAPFTVHEYLFSDYRIERESARLAMDEEKAFSKLKKMHEKDVPLGLTSKAVCMQVSWQR